MDRQTAYELADYEYRRSGWYICISAIPWLALIGAATTGLMHSALQLATYGAAIIAVEAIFVARSSLFIGLMQMRQQDEHRQDDARLVAAIEALTTELHRRPEFHSTVSFSLYGKRE